LENAGVYWVAEFTTWPFKQIKGNAVSKLNLDGLLVDSCIDELFSVGVLSQQHLKARAGYTAFTQRFVDFLKNPKEDL